MALQEPPVVQLGPLTDCLARRVILSLPWLERVRCERVSRGWLACLRSAPAATVDDMSVDTAAALAECRAAGLRFSRNKGREPEVVVGEALRIRAAASARSFRIGDDLSLLTLLVPAPAQGVASLCASDVSATALNAAFDALAGADGSQALPPRLRLQRVLLSNATGLADCDAMRLFTRRVAAAATERATAAKAAAAVITIAVAGDLSAEAAAEALELEAAADCAFEEAADAAQLHVRLSPQFLAYVEDAGDDAVVDDARVVRFARLGRALARQQWPRITTELYQTDDTLAEEGSAALATLLEVCFSSMQDELDVLHLAPLACDRRCIFDLRNSGAALETHDAHRVARAAPPHVRVLFGVVGLESLADVDNLPAILANNRGHGATVRLDFDGAIEPTVMSRILSALSAAGCSESGLDMSKFNVDAESAAHIFSGLRSLTTLRGLRLRLTGDSIVELLAVLPPSLRLLSIAGPAVTQMSHLLVAALQAGQLPLLDCLILSGASLKDGETARSLAEYVQGLSAPFTLRLACKSDEHSWDVLTSLIKHAPYSSGIPAYAAFELRHSTSTVPLALLNNALVASIFETLQEESEIGVHECQPPVFPICHVDCFVTACSSAFLAQLLLSLHDRAPTEMAALLCSHDRILLIAMRVRRARSQLALPGDLSFTPLLHRMMLIVAGGTAVLPQSVLSVVADACLRDEPADTEAEFSGSDEERERFEESMKHEVYETRVALLTMLLACALADKTCSGDPAFSGAMEWIELRSSWLLSTVESAGEQMAEDGSPSFLSFLGNRFQSSAKDGALYLWALSRVPSLHGKLFDPPSNLKEFLDEPTPTHWIMVLMNREPSPELFRVVDILASQDVANALYCHYAVNVVNAKPAVILDGSDDAEPLQKVYSVLLGWADSKAPPYVTGLGVLARLSEACIEHLPEGWPGLSSSPSQLAHTASLAWFLTTEDSMEAYGFMRVWMLKHISTLLRDVANMHAHRMPFAGKPGRVSFREAALSLRAAGAMFSSCLNPTDPDPEEKSFQFDEGFCRFASQLVTAGWVRSEGSVNPLTRTVRADSLFEAARIAHAAYLGLRQIIWTIPPSRVKALSAQLQASVPGGAPAVLDNLGRELARLDNLGSEILQLAALQRSPSIEHLSHSKRTANARADLTDILRKLRPALEPPVAGSLQLSTYAFAALTTARSVRTVPLEIEPETGAV